MCWGLGAAGERSKWGKGDLRNTLNSKEFQLRRKGRKEGKKEEKELFSQNLGVWNCLGVR